MQRTIKRYENRKLYDTTDKQYVSLEDIARMVRQGDEVSVIDNATGEDITTQTLTKVILEEGSRGGAGFPTELLHDMVRWGGKVVASGKEQVEKRVERLVASSLERMGYDRQFSEQVEGLKARLAGLEARLEELEGFQQQERSGE